MDFSLFAATVLLWKNSTLAFTLSTVVFTTFRESLINRFNVCAKHGWWVHFRIFMALVMFAALSLTHHTTLSCTCHSFSTFNSSSTNISVVCLSVMSKQSSRQRCHLVIFNKVASDRLERAGGSRGPAVSCQANRWSFFSPCLAIMHVLCHIVLGLLLGTVFSY